MIRSLEVKRWYDLLISIKILKFSSVGRETTYVCIYMLRISTTEQIHLPIQRNTNHNNDGGKKYGTLITAL